MNQPDPAHWNIGETPLRLEDARLITGLGRYVADLTAPGQLHCAFVRSPHAHARIDAIDFTAARAMPGVHAVLTGANMAADGIGSMRALWLVRGVDGPALEPPRWGLVRGRVFHIGEAVALVVAESRAAAEDAAEAVQVEYTELPTLTTARAALADGATLLHEEAPGNRCYRYERGNQAAAAAAFAGAAHVTRLSLVNQRVAGCALEPRALLAQPDGGAFTLYSSTQVPHHIKQLLCEQLLLTEDKVRVIAPDVGGGFGYKGKYYPEEAVLAWAALHLNRPLKWVATRGESFIADLQGRDHVTEAALALDGEGRFLGVQVETLVNLGAYVSTMGSAISSAIYTSLLCGMYRMPALHARVTGVFTNTLPTDAYRGAGRPEACYVLERLVDQAASELRIDSAELRRRNLTPASAMPYTTAAGPIYDSGDFPRVFESVLRLADHAGFEQRRAEAAARGLRLGLGIACFVESSGVGPSGFARAGGARVGLSENAEISVDADGLLSAVIGTQNHGQGHETVYTQILGARLGVAPHRVRIIEGDTGRLAEGTGTFGSRSVAVGGSALLLAADALIAAGKRAIAALWDVAPEEIAYAVSPQGGRYSAREHSMDFAQAARLIHDESGGDAPWFGAANFDPQAFAFSNGVHICEVAVDPATGVIHVKRYSAVDDVGNVIHPVIVEGQLHGGVAQGLGQALHEGVAYDEENGQLLTGSFMDYGLPRAHHMPPHFEGETDQSQPYKLNPLGAKGAGEAGTIAAPAALVNAVLDALRPLGVTDLTMPLTPAKVWAALQRAAAK